jgi:hypothetical protein
MSTDRRRRGSREAARAAAALAAFLLGLGCGSENAEPAPAAPTPSTPAPATAERAEEAAPAVPRAAAGVRRARDARREREALSVEERRALWRRRLGISEDPAERQRQREQAAVQDRARVTQLEDPDAGVRAEAVRAVDLQGTGRERVFALVSDDPLPAVRVAALERLYEEEAHTARKIARRGLTDREPEVVLVAIEVLGVVGDASSVPDLEPLAAEHEDPRVRKAAVEVIEFLR